MPQSYFNDKTYFWHLPTDIKSLLCIYLPYNQLERMIEILSSFFYLSDSTQKHFWKELYKRDFSEIVLVKDNELFTSKSDTFKQEDKFEKFAYCAIYNHILLLPIGSKLVIAAENGWEKYIKQLLPSLPLEVIQYYDDSPLSRAVQNGHLEVMKYLIKYGANINGRKNDLYLTAAVFAHLCVLLYLETFMIPDNVRELSFIMVCSGIGKRYLPIIEYLLNIGTNIDCFNGKALRLAISAKNTPLVKYLISRNANINYLSQIESDEYNTLLKKE